MPKTYYKKGDHNAVCDGCGRVFKASQLRKDHDGFLMCPDDWEPRHPQERPKTPRPDGLPVKNPRPEGVDSYIEEITDTDTTTVYSTDTDGFIHAQDTNLATLRASTSGFAVYTSVTESFCTTGYHFASYIGVGTYRSFRGYFPFDLSGLSRSLATMPSSMGTLSANLVLTSYGDGTDDVVVVESLATYPLSVDDYASIGSIEFGRTTAWEADGETNSIALNASALEYMKTKIGKGSADFCILNHRDFDNGDCTEVTGGGALLNPTIAGTYFNDSAIYKPYLEIIMTREIHE